mmetsp:Transcript_25523/g.63163  ORF Transcript_25523/g.63163 Transcript_25523/m.63163 type:complete len:95 (-) Transcript_25523:349-633(-)
MYGGGYYSPSKGGCSPGGDGYALHGLPRRHPGAHRLQYGRAEDGQAYDRQGRQIATSMVDEVIFNRSPANGKLHHFAPGINVGIDNSGHYARFS